MCMCVYLSIVYSISVPAIAVPYFIHTAAHASGRSKGSMNVAGSSPARPNCQADRVEPNY